MVTGSTQGIGLAIAIGLAKAGATVAGNGRTPERCHDGAGRRACPGARRAGGARGGGRCDRPGRSDLVAAVPDADVLVDNLGIFEAKPVLDVEDDEWRRYCESMCCRLSA